MKLTIGVPVHNCDYVIKLGLLNNLNILRNSGIDYKMVIIDDNSNMETKELLRKLSDRNMHLHVYHTEDYISHPNPNLGWNVNFLLDQVEPDDDYYLHLESDVFINEDTIPQLIKTFTNYENTKVAMPIFYFPDNRINWANKWWYNDIQEINKFTIQTWNYPIGCFLIKSDIARNKNIRIDPGIRLWGVDIFFSEIMQKHYPNGSIYNPNASVMHYQSASSKPYSNKEYFHHDWNILGKACDKNYLTNSYSSSLPLPHTIDSSKYYTFLPYDFQIDHSDQKICELFNVLNENDLDATVMYNSQLICQKYPFLSNPSKVLSYNIANINDNDVVVLNQKNINFITMKHIHQIRKVVFNQDSHYILNNVPEEYLNLFNLNYNVTDMIHTSYYNKDLLSTHLPDVNHHVVRTFFDKNIFQYSNNKKIQIAFVPGHAIKNSNIYACIQNLDIELVPIEYKTKYGVADILKDALIYLDWSEDCNSIAMEAIYSGCIILSDKPKCSIDHIDSEYFYELNKNISQLEFNNIMANIINIFKNDIDTLYSKTSYYSSKIIDVYNKNNFTKDILSIMGRLQGV